MTLFENITPFAPVHFFALQFDCHYFQESKKEAFGNSRHYLPDLAFINDLESFAELAMGWNEKGLYFLAKVKRPLLKVEFPNLQKGDALELLIDTRDVKTSGYQTRFCHHFYFLPEKIRQDKEEVPQAAEITRFRGEDAHELCDPSLLIVSTLEKSKSYLMNIFIPSECLNGYDPSQFDRLGFNYRINRYEGEPQCFSSNSNEFPIEQPSLWSSLKLIKP